MNKSLLPVLCSLLLLTDQAAKIHFQVTISLLFPGQYYLLYVSMCILHMSHIHINYETKNILEWVFTKKMCSRQAIKSFNIL